MKSILVNVPDQMKKKLDDVRRQGYSVNGYIRTVLEQSLVSPRDLNAIHLTRKDITMLEEALNTADLEYLVAAVDRIVDKRSRSLSLKRRQ